MKFLGDYKKKYPINNPEQLKNLWDVCRIPDFQNISDEKHLILLANVERALFNNEWKLYYSNPVMISGGAKYSLFNVMNDPYDYFFKSITTKSIGNSSDYIIGLMLLKKLKTNFLMRYTIVYYKSLLIKIKVPLFKT